ncbi:MAG: energy transducer TonB [Bacteroidaceae bacterium]|nr:energy transducer TonB [Bacteroidaceae bacterium]
MKKSLLLLSCVAFMLSCGGNENAKSDSAADKKKTEKKEKKSDDTGQTETVETAEPELPAVSDTVAIPGILDEEILDEEILDEEFLDEVPQRPRAGRPRAGRSAPVLIDSRIILIDENSEEEESDLVAPEDMSAWDDYADVEYAEVIELEGEEEEEIFWAVEQQASFPGGIQKMYEFLRDNIKYPAVSLNNNSQGTTLLRFVVQKDGRIVNINVIKSSGDVFLDNEAVRVVSSMPKWTPAKQNGRNVSSWYNLPIKFSLQ